MAETKEDRGRAEAEAESEKRLIGFLWSNTYRMVSSGLPAATVVRRLGKMTREMLEKGE